MGSADPMIWAVDDEMKSGVSDLRLTKDIPDKLSNANHNMQTLDKCTGAGLPITRHRVLSMIN